MNQLRDQMLVDLQLSGAKPNTQKSYLREVDNLAKYFNKSPAELGEDELKEYMLYLMKERHLSEGTFRFYVAALKFFYRTTLKREWMVEKIRHPRAKRKPPIVLESVRGEIPFCRHPESQAQSDPHDHLLIRIEGQ